MVSVIILSYNTKEITLKCLEFLFFSENVEFEVIVVDNASTDGSAEAVAEEFPNVKLIRSKDNLGFAKGNNVALKEAKGDLILLLNSDCFVFEDTLKKAQSLMGSEKHDVMGCLLLNPDGTTQPSFGLFPTLPRIILLMTFIDNLPVVRDFVSSIHIRSELSYTKKREIDWVMGAFVVMRREVYEKTGGFDENYFMYGEEVEWMYRMKKAGFSVMFDPSLRAVHLGGASVKSRSRILLSELEGLMYWYKKYNSEFEQKILGWILVAGSLFKAVVWTVVGKIVKDTRWGPIYWSVFNGIKSEVFGPKVKSATKDSA